MAHKYRLYRKFLVKKVLSLINFVEYLDRNFSKIANGGVFAFLITSSYSFIYLMYQKETRHLAIREAMSAQNIIEDKDNHFSLSKKTNK